MTSIQDIKIESCPLCNNDGEVFHKKAFYRCKSCDSIFKAAISLPDRAEEKEKYDLHNNDVNDVRYQQFVSPITNAVQRDYPTRSIGLDFGSGPGPVISKVLQDKGYTLKQFDPFFNNVPEVLEDKYDYIVCCEVIEHFHSPAKEFELLRSMLKPNGHLYCMTHLYSDDIDFNAWYYKNDPTHVFFYNPKSLQLIKNKNEFSSLLIEDRLITYRG